VGGYFESPKDLLLELFIGEEYELRSFETCEGLTSNIFVSTDSLEYSPIINTKPIKANVSNRVAVCGTVGDVIDQPQLNVGTGFTLFTATDFTSYDSCEDCGQLLNTILYVRTGVDEYVTTRTMTKSNIDNVLANGPIFTTGGVEAYEIINYYY
jgi:hypothetical protein